MRRIKKLIVFLVTLALVFNTLVSVPIFAEDNEIPTEAIDVLRTLEIIPDYYDYNADVSSYATRADFAVAVAKIIGADGYSNEEVYYYDVPKTHWAHNEISALTERGIIKGNGEKLFHPDEKIEYAAAYKMLLEPMGYGQYAAYSGGYPNGYSTAAKRTGLSSEVVNGEYVTKGDMFRILYNALICNIYDIEAISDDSVELAVSEYETLLSFYRNIYYAEGYVMGVNCMTLDDGILEAGTVMVDDTVYDTEFNSSELLGRHVKFFYSENSEDSKTILWMGETGRSDVKKIEIDQSVSFDSLSYKLTYYDASNRRRTLDINRGAIVVYNGDVVNGNYSNFFTKPRYKMTLIENDKADDVVIIKCYTNYVVDAIDADTSVIYDAHVVNDKLILDSNAYEYMSIKMLGVNEIDFSEISLGSVLSVYLSENKEYLEVFVSNSKEDGNVSKIANGFHGKIITINNIEYFVPDDVDVDDLAPGRHCSVYTDAFGDVAYIETVNLNYFAAYLMGAALDGVFTQQMKIKMLRQNGKIDVLDCADKIIVDGMPYELGRDVNNLYINGTFKQQLAMIELNSDGKIKRIDTAYRNEFSEPVNSLTPNVTEVYANYKTAGVIGSKSVINNATVLFVVPVDTEHAAAKDEDYYIANKADLKNDTKLTYASYKTKERVGYEEFVVIKGDPTADNTDKPVLVTNIGAVMNDEGEIVSCIYGYCGNELQTFCAANETVSFEGIVQGSLIRIYKDHNGDVENYEMIFDYNKLELGSANIIDTDEINTINGVYTVTCGYVNDVVDGVVSISKDKGGETGRVMYTNGIPVLVYDSSKRDGYNISIGNINDARTYQAAKDDCSMIIMTGVRTLPNMFVIYN